MIAYFFFFDLYEDAELEKRLCKYSELENKLREVSERLPSKSEMKDLVIATAKGK